MFQNDISFVYKDIEKNTTDLEAVIKNLLIKHLNEGVAAPYFYEWELDKLSGQLPSSWTLDINEKLDVPDEKIRLTIVNAYFEAERHFKGYLDEFEDSDVRLIAEPIGVIDLTGEESESIIAITDIEAPYDEENAKDLLELSGAFGESPIKISVTPGSKYWDSAIDGALTFSDLFKDDNEWKKYIDSDDFELDQTFLKEIKDFINELELDED